MRIDPAASLSPSSLDGHTSSEDEDEEEGSVLFLYEEDGVVKSSTSRPSGGAHVRRTVDGGAPAQL